MHNFNISATAKWRAVNWFKVQNKILKLQNKIFITIRFAEPICKVHNLQKILLESQAAKFFAVYLISQNINFSYKNTDFISQSSCWFLAQNINLTKRISKVQEQDLLKQYQKIIGSFNTFHFLNKVKQILLLMVLEPEWEAKFDTHSYGCRPGKCSHDALKYLILVLKKRPMWALSSSIQKSTVGIKNELIIKKINSFYNINSLLTSFLRYDSCHFNLLSLVWTHLKWSKIVISKQEILYPFLTNVFLNGLEAYLLKVFYYFEFDNTLKSIFTMNDNLLVFVRYSNTFIICNPSKKIINKLILNVENWLSKIGLNINPFLTFTSHSLKKNKKEVASGFEFLNLSFKHYIKKNINLKLCFLTQPSKNAYKQHFFYIKRIISTNKATKQKILIKKLNPLIYYWSNYYKPFVKSKNLSKCDYKIFKMLWRWACRRHPNKNKTWIKNKYFSGEGNDKWKFVTRESNEITLSLQKYRKVGVKYFNIVKSEESPYNGNFQYWINRFKLYPILYKEYSSLCISYNTCCILVYNISVLYKTKRYTISI